MRVQMLFRLSLGALLSQLRRARPSGAITTGGASSPAGGQKEWRSTRAPSALDTAPALIGDVDLARLRRTDHLGGLIHEYRMVA